jgi:endonuclease-3 related protein
MVEKIYNMLLKKYGRQNWWPMSGRFVPKELEICIGAILTQNTNWKSVEKALQNLLKAEKVSAKALADLRLSELEKLIKPSGFYKQKARRLKDFANFVANFDGDFYKDVTREQLLAINGIGQETADSILLYACNKPVFVIDAYTRRLFSRLGMIKGDEDYDYLRNFFEARLRKDAELYKEFHALIVEHEKRQKKLSERNQVSAEK